MDADAAAQVFEVGDGQWWTLGLLPRPWMGSAIVLQDTVLCSTVLSVPWRGVLAGDRPIQPALSIPRPAHKGL